MANEIQFWGNGTQIPNTSGSGVGFYGDSGFGASIAVSAWQGRSYMTNSAGSSLGLELPNCKWLNSGSGVLGQTGSGIALTAIPNAQSTVEVRARFDSSVKVPTVRAYCYDRVSKNNPPSGVVLAAAEIIHPTTTQLNNGSGDTTWTYPAGTGTYLTLAPSPGTSGLYAGNGSNGDFSSDWHSWFLALSASPSSVGSKTQFGLLIEVEYL